MYVPTPEHLEDREIWLRGYLATLANATYNPSDPYTSADCTLADYRTRWPE